MDKARKQTDRKLNSLEREIRTVYDNSPLLAKMQKKYKSYMKRVQRLTAKAYNDYRNAPIGSDERKELKKVYQDELRKYTLESNEYKKIVNDFVVALSDVNQQALDIVNDAMPYIYKVNYNQVADDCREAGIKVNG